jgi:Rod binding domain-containing protein
MQPILAPTFMPMPLQGYQKPTGAEREAQLKKAVDDFASILFSQMFREMRESAGGEDEGGIFGGGDTNVLMHLMDQELGKAYTTASGNTLREAMLRQLLRQDGQEPTQRGAGQ